MQISISLLMLLSRVLNPTLYYTEYFQITIKKIKYTSIITSNIAEL